MNITKASPHSQTRSGSPATTHPSWCTGINDPIGCRVHLADATLVPATAAGWKPLAGTAAYPALEVAAALTPDGIPAVFAAATAADGTLVELTFRIGEVERLVAVLRAALATAEGGAL